MSIPYDTQRADYIDALKGWKLVRDCVAGTKAVKSDPLYMVQPDPDDKSPENVSRLLQLIKRAMFLNVTGRTRTGLVGAVFRKDAEVELPTSIDYIEDNASGDNVSLCQFAKRLVSELLMVGRAGILVEYPSSMVPDGQSIPLTRSQTDGNRSYMHFYPSESIINWHTEVINGVRVLTLVVLYECVSKLGDDGFSQEVVEQYRALRLIDGEYVQELYSDGALQSSVTPKKANGQSFDSIPFHFAGAENNDDDIDIAPLYDLAEVNILHYQNSATVEDSAFIASQPTLFITTDLEGSDFSESNPHGLKLGSRAGYNLGKNGTATLLQASESQLALTLMDKKEQQMVMIGARIVQDSSSNETAQAARIKHTGDNSVLSNITGNASSAILMALNDVFAFMSAAEPNDDEITYTLNQEFFDEPLDAPTILALVQAWQQGVFAKSDLRTNMRQSGFIDPSRTDAEIDEELSEQAPISGTAQSTPAITENEE